MSGADNRVRTHDFARYRLSVQVVPPRDSVTALPRIDLHKRIHAQVVNIRGGAFSHLYRCHHPNAPSPPHYTGPWTGAPMNATLVGSGDGLVELASGDPNPEIAFTFRARIK